MEFNNYQEKVLTDLIYKDFIRELNDDQEKFKRLMGLSYVVLGLTGEAGELAEKVKKIMRDDLGNIREDQIEELAKELGDVLWYVAAIAKELNLELDYIAKQNIIKLDNRKKNNKLKGKGDDR